LADDAYIGKSHCQISTHFLLEFATMCFLCRMNSTQ